MTVVFVCVDADALGGVQQVTHTLAQGLAVLTDPISSNMGGIPLLGLAVLGWRRRRS